MRILSYILAAVALFGQSQNEIKVIPKQDDSATGLIKFQEKYGNGSHFIGLRAPASLAGSVTFTLPNADGAANKCLSTDGSATLGWSTCGGGTYDVTSYGAMCDGVTDDTTAIQDAIDAAEAAGGGMVIFPEKTCLVSTVNVTGDFIGFQGKHRNATVLKGSANQKVVHLDTTASDIYFFQARHMTIQGNGGAASAAFEITGGNSFERSVFEDIYIVDVRRGVYAHNTGGMNWFSYRDNYCDTVTVSGGTCIDISSTTGANQSVIANSMFANHTAGTGIKYTGEWFGDNVVTGNNNEQGNYFMYLDCGPTCSYGANWLISGNKIDNTLIAPFYFNNIQTSTVSWNRILGGVADSVSVNGNSDQLTLDSYYASGIRNTKANEQWALGAFSSGRLRLGEIDANLSNTTNGISVKDDDEASALAIGQATGANVGLLWVYDATPANGYGVLYTANNDNAIAYRALYHSFETDGAGRWLMSATGMFYPQAADTYDIGVLASNRVRGVYAQIVDTAKSGGTNDYIQTRKLQLFDNTGSTTAASYWDLNVVMSGAGVGQDSYAFMRDNGGTKVFQAERIRAGVAVDRTFWYTDLYPDTTGGQSLGSATYEWDKVYANQLGDSSNSVIVWGGNSEFTAITTPTLTLSSGGTVTINTRLTGDLLPVSTTTYTLGSSTYKWLAVHSSYVDVYTDLQMNTGSTITGDFVPSANNTYSLGSSTNGFLKVWTGDIRATGQVTFSSGASNNYLLKTDGSGNASWTNAISINTATLAGTLTATDILPSTNNLYTFGNSSFKWAAAYIQNAYFYGNLQAPNGSNGQSVTVTVRDSAGTGTCTLIFSGGLKTGGTC